MHQGAIRTLHVDDEPNFADLAATFLEREDVRLSVTTATSAAEALDIIRDRPPDCIVSDYDMPGQNGIEFLDVVRDDYPDLPFILFTGKGNEEIASEAITAGVTDYLQKDSGTEQYTILANRIANAVDRFRARRQIDRRHQALETASEGLSLVRPDDTFSYVNSAFAQLFGYDQDELIGNNWTVLYHDEEAERLENEILPAVQETGYWSGETVRLTNRGDRLVTDHRLTRADKDTIVCTAKDLTEERSAHSEQETTFDLLLDTIGGEGYVFFTLDHEGYITRWNDGAKRLYGYDADEVLGDHLSTLSTDANRQKNVPEELLDTAWKDGSATNEGYLLRKDGCRFRAEVTISAGYDKDGTLRGFGVVTREATEPATERKEREEQLRQTKAKLEALFQESPDLINFHDIDGNIFDPNPELCAETGYDATELTDMKVWELDQSIDPEAVCALWRSMEPGDRRRLEGVYQRKDGSTFPVEVHIRHLRSNEEDLFVVIARDITDRKARERKLEGQNEQLEEFAGVVSHDIRNPLRNAQGRLELVREECDSEHIDPIDRSLTRIDTLIDDLLSLARDGDRLSETEPVDLAELSEECWRTVETADATVQAPIDRTVHADKSRLAQLLENLFRNAVEHAGKEVTIRVGELDSESGFYVEDDGPGIPEDERESVFDAGYTSAPEGTGFGLSIVEQVAEAHGWDVRVTDGNAGGARFDITGVEFVE